MTNDTLMNPSREENRQLAQRKLGELIALLHQMPAVDGAADLAVEAESLNRSIGAFHLEGIRFRTFKFDRLLQRLPDLPAEATQLFAEVRAALEAAGVQTRSH